METRVPGVLQQADDVHRRAGRPIQCRGVDLVDYEGELGVVIGSRCRHVPAAGPRGHRGYTVVDDVTVRDWQFKAPTMTIGKIFDTHGPIGPWIVTADEIADPQDLAHPHLGERRPPAGRIDQGDDLRLAQQIETLSTAFTLEPGDLIATGTPAGIGIVRQPPISSPATRPHRDRRHRRLENPVIADTD